MILYVTENRYCAVRYVSLNGTYDIVEIIPFAPEDQWKTLANRDWMGAAKELADNEDSRIGGT